MEKTFICDSRTVVETTKGKVKGYAYDGIMMFKGIPYAKAKRFHAPEPVDAWEGIFDATNYGYVCPLMEVGAPNGEVMVPHRYWVMNENCQNLNVWTPACDDKKRPVLVWFHGGGFEAGSSIEQVAYEGENMCKEGDVVVVSVNHRLNVLGYMDLSDFGPEYKNSGNAGSSDLIASLKWVKENIEAFGGDPENVTIFGQSGGGAKVITLMQTPEADGLYTKAMIMSGLLLMPVMSDQIGSGKELVEGMMKELNISDVKELETVDYNALVKAYQKLKPQMMANGKYIGCAPQKNDVYLGEPVANGFRTETNKIPVIIGTVYGEFSGFGAAFENKKDIPAKEQEEIAVAYFGKEIADELIPLYKEAYPERNLVDLQSLDFMFRVPTKNYIDARRQLDADTYVYMFNQDLPINGGQVPWHCADIPYVFKNCDLVPVTQEPGVTKVLEQQIFDCVMAFARTGNPNHDGIPTWPKSTKDTEYMMVFDKNTRVRENLDAVLMPVYAKYAGPIMQRHMAEMFENAQH